MVRLSQEDIDRIVTRVPGGARNVQDIYPLAPQQEGLLFHHLIDQDYDPYVASSLMRFDSPERLGSYLESLQRVIARHDILRTALQWEGLAEPVQVVWRRAPLLVEDVMLEPSASDPAQQLRDHFASGVYRLDIQRAPLMRCLVAPDSIAPRRLLLILHHHLISDHRTMEVLHDEVQTHLSGRSDLLPPSIPYRNFVAHARQSVSRDEHETFFRKLLGDIEEGTVPFGLVHAQGHRHVALDARLRLGPALTQQLGEQARAFRVSVACLCHVAWALVLSRTSRRDDVVFGTVLLGRMQGLEGAERALGMLVNTLPVRIRVGREGVETVVKRTHGLLTELLRHEQASLALAQRCSGVTAPAPLFTALLDYRRFAMKEGRRAALPDLEGVEFLGGSGRASYPLSLVVDDLGSDLELVVQVEKPVVASAVCDLMQMALRELVDALRSAPERPLRELDVLPASERHRLLVQWNETEARDRTDELLHSSFEERARCSPDAVAAVHEGAELSYRELNERANRLARYLRKLGVGPDKRVGICVERGFEMLIGLLGILKAGGAYVPLDPSYPVERLSYMLSDSKPELVLIHPALPEPVRAKLVNDAAIVVLDLVEHAGLWRGEPDANMGNDGLLEPEHLAYLIYTSGSTGAPRGVAITHRNAVHSTQARIAYYLEPLRRFLLISSFAFDSSVAGIFWTLSKGGALVIPSSNDSQNVLALAELLVEQHIDHVLATPGFLQQTFELVDAARLSRLEVAIAAGEACPLELVDSQRKRFPSLSLFNEYGPTEAAVWATVWSSREAIAEQVPIGRPIQNVRVYIVDSDLRPVPTGVVGELLLGGAGLARGYHDRPALTAERFIPDPFSGTAGARLYRTGDLARYRADGHIEFLGRADFQVKLRGFRIELGEIEASLLLHPELKEAVVQVREDDRGTKQLIAHYVPVRGAAGRVDAAALRAHLADRLPSHMVPTAYVCMERLPRTVHGKIDRKALPAPERVAYTGADDYQAPIGEVEQALARLWQSALNVERVGRGDNFFALGGDSLLVVTLIEQMRREGLHVDVRSVFSAPTLKALADVAKADTPDKHTVDVPPNPIPFECDRITPELLPLVRLNQEQIDRIIAHVPGGARNVQDIYPLAPLQEGILFHHLMAGAGDPYLRRYAMRFDSRDRMDRYIDSLTAVIERHEFLRTGVHWEGLLEPIQVVWRRAPIVVEEVTFDPSEATPIARLMARFDLRCYRLDVRQAPWIRMFIARDADESGWVALLLTHDIWSDHTALGIVHAEVQAYLLGEGDRLPAPLPYRNFVAQARWGITRDQHESFFRALLGDVDWCTAPFGLTDAQCDRDQIAEHRRRLPPALARRLREQAKTLHVSVACLCHVAWALVLSRISGRDDVVFGTVLLGRMNAGAEADRVGMYMNTLPVRIRVGGDATDACVKSTHALLTQLLRHEHAPLVVSQRCSKVAHPLPLFTSLLNYRHSDSRLDTDVASRAWQGIELLNASESTNYPVTLSIDDFGDDLGLAMQTQMPVDPISLVDLMQQALDRVVEVIEGARETPLNELDVLPASERRRVLVEWNRTEVEYPTEKCVHHLFEEQVERSPERIALVFEDTEVSYRELDERASRLARHLRSLGVKPDSRVALCADGSIEMVVGVLAILEAGGAYVPLDPSYPRERLSYILADCEPELILTHTDEGHRQMALLGAKGNTRVLDSRSARGRGGVEPGTPPPADAIGLKSHHLACVLYTSGSTGKPKGVMIEHRCVVNMLLWLQQTYALGAADALLQSTPLGFDVSLTELFWPLLAGARLVLPSPEAHKDPEYLAALIARHSITAMNFVPSMLEVFVEQGLARGCATLKRVMSAGEVLPVALVRRFNSDLPQAFLHNIYGPTEALYSTEWACASQPSGDSIPIGRPIANMRIYILDSHGRPVPPGVVGELYVAGAQVARGYLNRAELTKERFTADPFSQSPGARMYKTGDVGRHRADGTIEFLGRMDDQVKLRGFRIELREIEAAMMASRMVKEAVVVLREDSPGDKRLVAYYTPRHAASERAGGAPELRAHLSAVLPKYLLPAAYVALDGLPKTPNGKLDRLALPAPTGMRPELGEPYAAPKTAHEAAIAKIWSEALRLERVGIHDDFFELGGHSLLALTVISRVRSELHVDLSLNGLFECPTIARLAKRIATSARPVLRSQVVEGLT